MQTYLSGHGAYRLQYHIVWVTKYRRKVLKPALQTTLKRYLVYILRGTPGCRIETIGFDPDKLDHVHMVMIIPPKYRIADVMARMKSQSSSHLRQKFPFLKQVYWKESIVWSPGYFVSSVGIDEDTIKHYVEYQGKRDSGQVELQF
jgi:putative transposase